MDKRRSGGRLIVEGAAGLMGPPQGTGGADGPRAARRARSPQATAVSWIRATSSFARLQLRHRLATGRHHVGRQPHTGGVRAGIGAFSGVGLHGSHPEPRESRAGRRDLRSSSPTASGTTTRRTWPAGSGNTIPCTSILTLIFESPDAAVLENPDNLVIVPKTGHILRAPPGSTAERSSASLGGKVG